VAIACPSFSPPLPHCLSCSLSLSYSPGLNLVIVSRTQSKLDEFAKELDSAYGVEVRTCAVDLCHLDAEAVEAMTAAIQGIEVGILVNNAGMSYDHPEYLEEMESARDVDIIMINALAPTLVRCCDQEKKKNFSSLCESNCLCIENCTTTASLLQ